MTARQDLCCEHGETILARLDRLTELMEDLRTARVEKFAIGGVVDGPRPLVGGGGSVDCLVPNAFDEFHRTKDHPFPDFKRVMLNREVAANENGDEPMQVTEIDQD